MRLVRARLHNICQHRDLDIQFKSGLIGIIGANGAGKSNLINTIQSSLTNNFNVNTDGVKADNIRYGTGDTDSSYVITNWEHNNCNFEICRGLKNKSNYLKYSDIEVKNATEINEEINRILNASKEIIDFMFVPQWQTFSFISRDFASRAKLFATLCNTSIFSKISNLVYDEIRASQSKVVGIVDNRTILQVKINNKKNEIAKLNKQIDSLKQNVLTDVDAEAYTNVVYNRNLFIELTNKCKKLKQDISDLAANATSLTDQIKTRQKHLNSYVEYLNNNKQEFELYNNVANIIKNNKKYLSDIAQTDLQLKKLIKPIKPEQLPGHRVELYNYWKSKILELSVERAGLLNLIQLKKKDRCHVCNTPIANLKNDIDNAIKRIDEIDLSLSNYQEDIDLYEQYERDYKIYSDNLFKYNATASALISKKNELEEKIVEVDKDETQITEFIKTYTNTQASQNGAEKHLLILQNNLTTQQKLLEEKENELHETEERLIVCDSNDQIFAEAQAKLKRHKEASQLISSANFKIGLYQQDIDTDTQTVELINNKLKEVALYTAWINDLQEIKDIVHNDNFPKLIAQAWLSNICVLVNKILEDFESPFTIKIGDDLSFVAIKPNGREEVATRLSGGEKMILAIAFRFAVNSILAGNMGILVLDEPTAGIDKQNVVNLAEILVNVSKYTQRNNSQIIIITHDETLERVFDQVIKLEKPHGN